VADDPDDYARLALAVARDRDRNQQLRRELAARREMLFGRHDCFLAFQDALIAVGRGSR
jgi:predicted O-linked N-acetylglucosamine transferase (SPINDLY family)